VLTRAAVAWRVGRPHLAWQILDQAGMRDDWREFQRVALQRARDNYRARMNIT